MALQGKKWRYAEVALLISGVGLLIVYALGLVDASLGRQHALSAFAEAHAEAAPASFGRIDESAVNVPDQSLWAPKRIEEFRSSLDLPMGVPEGVLQIPAIDLVVPIFDSTEELMLNRGVGHIEETAMVGSTGNVGIAGHRDGFFRGLKDLNVGDLIEVDGLNGTHNYRIAEIVIVDPSDVSVLAPGDEPMLTLVTCYPFYFVGHAPQRYIVRAVMTDHTLASE